VSRVLPRTCDVAIVGAGAAGLATAIFTRRHNRSASVILLERARRPGAKILVSGGARCNVTNASVTERDFWGGPRPIVRRVLRAFPVSETVAFFRDIGVRLHEEADGKLFPDSNRARDVLDALLGEAGGSGATLISGCLVSAVHRTSRGFLIGTSDGEIEARAVVLAAGGQSLPKSGSDGSGFALARSLGHAIVPPTPALVPLLLDPDDGMPRVLSGVSQPVELALRVDGSIAMRLEGPLLWTHFGISGPVALDLSRHWLRARLEGRTVSVTANFRPSRGFDEVDREWQALARARPRASVQSALAAMLPASAAASLLRRVEIAGGAALAHLGRDERRRLSRALIEWPLPVVDSRGYTYAEATAGGVPLTEIDAATMASRVCPGLWIVGEVLDVDGRIGGFNFQWAWSSGFVAGRALSERTIARADAAVPILP
jgi:predicted Rossmann fold flavoprotein